MTDIIRQSPIRIHKKALQTEKQGAWTVVLSYADEGTGPFIVDLSHKPRWDIQDGSLDRLKIPGFDLPAAPGGVVLKNSTLVNRMNRTQAAMWLLGGSSFTAPDDPAFTDTTDATILLALFGRNLLRIAEKVSALDFSDPGRPDPCLFQGPLNHVPCQIVWIDRFSEDPCLLLTCSRGYARDMLHGLLKSGKEFGLETAGEAAFSRWLQGRKKSPIG